MPLALSVAAGMPDETTRARLESLGFELGSTADVTADVIADTASPAAGATENPAATATESKDVGILTTALQTAREADALAVLADRGTDTAGWRRDAVAILGEASALSAELSHPIGLIVLPATIAPRPGPVVVLSPAASASSYELYVAAALAAASDRRVEHLTSRGSRGSITSTGAPARAAARAVVSDWRERAVDRPERAVHTLAVRPAIIVAAVPPGSADAAALVADHPDADIVLVFDAVHARLGAATAARISGLVETALGVQLDLDAAPIGSDSGAAARADAGADIAATAQHPTDAPAADLPAILASDVVHVRMTDTAVEATNRSLLRTRVQVALGARSDPDHALADIDMVLEPGEARSAATGELAAIAALTPPEAVLRHWSHEDAEVYEGGERRIVQVRVRVLDASGTERAAKAYPVPNGLDFSLTSRDLTALLGRSSTAPALPDPVARAMPPASHDLLGELESALAVGRSLLARAAR